MISTKTSSLFWMAVKTDQSRRMPRLICVCAGCTGRFVGFDMLQLSLLCCLSSTSIQVNLFHIKLYISVYLKTVRLPVKSDKF